tara:strand:+ start:4317 stop:4520 length:204 start_codon:yes stop_codon:yes gene_type:complete
MDKGALTGIIIGVVIFIAIVSMMAGSGPSAGGSKRKMKFLNHKLGYVGLTVVILAALGLGGVVNSMM